MVERIVGFQTQLDVLGLGKVDLLIQGDVKVIDPRAIERGAGRVADTRSGGSWGERRRIKPVIRLSSDGPSAGITVGGGDSLHSVRAVPAGNVIHFTETQQVSEGSAELATMTGNPDWKVVMPVNLQPSVSLRACGTK